MCRRVDMLICLSDKIYYNHLYDENLIPLPIIIVGSVIVSCLYYNTVPTRYCFSRVMSFYAVLILTKSYVLFPTDRSF